MRNDDIRDEWVADGEVVHSPDGTISLSAELGAEYFSNFFTQVVNASSLNIRFNDTTLAPWTLDLSGMSLVASRFIVCQTDLVTNFGTIPFPMDKPPPFWGAE
jgi:hypothetical protein